MNVKPLLSAILAAGWMFLLGPSHAMTPAEILEENSRRSMVESFRMGVDITNTKREKVLSKHFFWVVGRTDENGTSMFVEFEKPEETKGMRFLFKYLTKEKGQSTKAFAYIPVTGSTIPMKASGSQDIGGTGMRIEDFRGFVPSKGTEPRLVGREHIGERECYVLEIDLPEEKQKSRFWISVDQFLVVRNQKLNHEGQLEREFRVVEFFTTKDGKMWPRKEEIYVPKEDATIVVEQQSGVYNIDIPDELLDPETFGAFQWRSPAIW